MYHHQIASNYTNYASPQTIKTGSVYVSNRGLQHINCILPSNKNQGALYLGDVICTLKTDLLQKHEIRTILTCMTEPISKLDCNINHKILPIKDNIEFPISFYFNQAKQFIDQSRSKGHNVLVHCHAGVSRSAAIVCAYLMMQNKWPTESALGFVRQKRYRAKPNAGFLSQLNLFWQKQVKSAEHGNRGKQIIKKQAKTIIIKLEQQVQTHDELFWLEQKRKLSNQYKKNSKIKDSQKYKSNHRKYDLSKRQPIDQKPSTQTFKADKPFQQQKSPSSITHPNPNHHKNLSQIRFNKAFDPKLIKSNVQLKNLSFVTSIQNQSTLQVNKPGSINFTANSTLQKNSKNTSIVKANELKTPVKYKIDNQLQMVSNRVAINSGQTTPKNYSRYSLPGQTTSYKQYY